MMDCRVEPGNDERGVELQRRWYKAPPARRTPEPRQDANGNYGTPGRDCPDHSGLMPANFTTLPHFSVSSANSLQNSAGETASTVQPRSAMRALIVGSARPAFTSRLSMPTIAAGVSFGTPNPS